MNDNWARRYPSDPALRLLAENLCRIFETQYPSAICSIRREQYASALVQLTDFLEANDFPAFVVHRLCELVLGLRGLDSGRSEEWLDRAPSPDSWNRHSDPTFLWTARAYAVIALDVLVEDQTESLRVQSWVVAKAFMLAFPKITIKAGAVRKWRERFKKGQVKDTIAAAIFANKIQIIAKVRDILESTGDEPSASAIATLILNQLVR